MKKGTIFFLVSIVLISIFYDYHNVLFKKNGYIHQWRQTDCLSITQNYYKENLPFHKPKIHHISDREGKRGVASEFPIIYYTIAQVWKLVGKSEAISRGFNLLIVFLGLFYLFKLCYKEFNSILYSIILSLFLFTSPIIVYYSNNFLSDSPALGLTLIGWYFFYNYYQLLEEKQLRKAFLFFLLAGLIKVSSLFSFFAIGGVFLIERLLSLPFKPESYLFKKKHFFYFLTVIMVIFLWYSYAVWYSEKEGNSYVFLKGILPIWELGEDRIVETFSKLYSIQLSRVFSPIIHLITIIFFVINMVNFKKINRFLATVNLLLFIGVILFFTLFFQVFDIHDYYIINSLIFYAFTWFSFFHFLKQKTKLLKSKLVLILSGAAFLLSVSVAGVQNRHRYNVDDPIIQLGLDHITEHDKEIQGWFQYDYRKNLKAFETITPYLRSLNINREDVVMVLGDLSINISLYNMDQIGFTNYCDSEGFDNQIELAKSHGAKYLFISKYKLKDFKEYEPYMKYQIGQHENILIYDLRPL